MRRFHEAKIFRHPEQNFVIFPGKVPVCQERFRCLEHLKYMRSWINEYSKFKQLKGCVENRKSPQRPGDRKAIGGLCLSFSQGSQLTGLQSHRPPSSHTQPFSCLRAFAPAVPPAWKTLPAQLFLSLIIIIPQVLAQKSRCFP